MTTCRRIYAAAMLLLLVFAISTCTAQIMTGQTYSSLETITDPTDLSITSCTFNGGLLIQNGLPKLRKIVIQWSNFVSANVRFLNMSFAPGSIIEILYNNISTNIMGVYFTDGGYDGVSVTFSHNLATVTSSGHVLAFKQESTSILTRADNMTLTISNNTVSVATNNCNAFWLNLASVNNSNISVMGNTLTFNDNSAAGFFIMQNDAEKTTILVQENTIRGKTNSAAQVFWYQGLSDCRVTVQNNDCQQISTSQTASALYSSVTYATNNTEFFVLHNTFSFSGRNAFGSWHQGTMNYCKFVAQNNTFSNMNASALSAGFVIAYAKGSKFSFLENSGTILQTTVHFVFFTTLQSCNVSVQKNRVNFVGAKVRAYVAGTQTYCRNDFFDNELLANVTAEADGSAILYFENATSSHANITKNRLAIWETSGGQAQMNPTVGIQFTCDGGDFTANELKLDLQTTEDRPIHAISTVSHGCMFSLVHADIAVKASTRSASCFLSEGLNDTKVSIAKSQFSADSNTSSNTGYDVSLFRVRANNYVKFGNIERNEITFDEFHGNVSDASVAIAIHIDGSMKDMLLSVKNSQLHTHAKSSKGDAHAINIESTSINDTTLITENVISHSSLPTTVTGGGAAFYTIGAKDYQTNNVKVVCRNNIIYVSAPFAVGYQMQSNGDKLSPVQYNVTRSHQNETIYITSYGGGNTPVGIGYLFKHQTHSITTLDDVSVITRTTSNSTYCGGLLLISNLRESHFKAKNFHVDVEAGVSGGCILPIGASEHMTVDTQNMNCSVNAPHAMGLGTLLVFSAWKGNNGTYILRDSTVTLKGNTRTAGVDVPTIGKLKIERTNFVSQGSPVKAFGIETASKDVSVTDSNFSLSATNQSAGASILSPPVYPSKWEFLHNVITVATTTEQPQENTAAVSLSEELTNFTLNVSTNQVSTDGVVLDLRRNVSSAMLFAASNNVQQTGNGIFFFHMNASLMESNVSLIRNMITSAKGNHTTFLNMVPGNDTFLPQSPGEKFYVYCNFVNSVECNYFPATVKQLEYVPCGTTTSPASSSTTNVTETEITSTGHASETSTEAATANATSTEAASSTSTSTSNASETVTSTSDTATGTETSGAATSTSTATNTPEPTTGAPPPQGPFTTTHKGTLLVPCNKCSYDNGYNIMDCLTDIGVFVLRKGCDSNCANCTDSYQYPLGVVALDPSGSMGLKTKEFMTCNSSIKTEYFNGDNCTSLMSKTFYDIAEVCRFDGSKNTSRIKLCGSSGDAEQYNCEGDIPCGGTKCQKEVLSMGCNTGYHSSMQRTSCNHNTFPCALLEFVAAPPPPPAKFPPPPKALKMTELLLPCGQCSYKEGYPEDSMIADCSAGGWIGLKYGCDVNCSKCDFYRVYLLNATAEAPSGKPIKIKSLHTADVLIHEQEFKSAGCASANMNSSFYSGDSGICRGDEKTQMSVMMTCDMATSSKTMTFCMGDVHCGLDVGETTAPEAMCFNQSIPNSCQGTKQSLCVPSVNQTFFLVEDLTLPPPPPPPQKLHSTEMITPCDRCFYRENSLNDSFIISGCQDARKEGLVTVRYGCSDIHCMNCSGTQVFPIGYATASWAWDGDLIFPKQITSCGTILQYNTFSDSGCAMINGTMSTAVGVCMVMGEPSGGSYRRDCTAGGIVNMQMCQSNDCVSNCQTMAVPSTCSPANPSDGGFETMICEGGPGGEPSTELCLVTEEIGPSGTTSPPFPPSNATAPPFPATPYPSGGTFPPMPPQISVNEMVFPCDRCQFNANNANASMILDCSNISVGQGLLKYQCDQTCSTCGGSQVYYIGVMTTSHDGKMMMAKSVHTSNSFMTQQGFSSSGCTNMNSTHTIGIGPCMVDASSQTSYKMTCTAGGVEVKYCSNDVTCSSATSCQMQTIPQTCNTEKNEQMTCELLMQPEIVVIVEEIGPSGTASPPHTSPPKIIPPAPTMIHDSEMLVSCGRCQWKLNEPNSSITVDCSTVEAGYVTLKYGCDPTCAGCTNSMQYWFGMPQVAPDGENIMVKSLHMCSSFMTQKSYIDPGCSNMNSSQSMGIDTCMVNVQYQMSYKMSCTAGGVEMTYCTNDTTCSSKTSCQTQTIPQTCDTQKNEQMMCENTAIPEMCLLAEKVGPSGTTSPPFSPLPSTGFPTYPPSTFTPLPSGETWPPPPSMLNANEMIMPCDQCQWMANDPNASLILDCSSAAIGSIMVRYECDSKCKNCNGMQTYEIGKPQKSHDAKIRALKSINSCSQMMTSEGYTGAGCTSQVNATQMQGIGPCMTSPAFGMSFKMTCGSNGVEMTVCSGDSTCTSTSSCYSQVIPNDNCTDKNGKTSCAVLSTPTLCIVVEELDPTGSMRPPITLAPGQTSLPPLTFPPPTTTTAPPSTTTAPPSTTDTPAPTQNVSCTLNCGSHGHVADSTCTRCQCDHSTYKGYWRNSPDHGNCGNCDFDYFGTLCTSTCPMVTTKSTVCNGHGICDSGKTGTGACLCFPPWLGTLCTSKCPTGTEGYTCGSVAAAGSCDASGVCQCSTGFTYNAVTLLCDSPATMTTAPPQVTPITLAAELNFTQADFNQQEKDNFKQTISEIGGVNPSQVEITSVTDSTVTPGTIEIQFFIKSSATSSPSGSTSSPVATGGSDEVATSNILSALSGTGTQSKLLKEKLGMLGAPSVAGGSPTNAPGGGVGDDLALYLGIAGGVLALILIAGCACMCKKKDNSQNTADSSDPLLNMNYERGQEMDPFAQNPRAADTIL